MVYSGDDYREDNEFLNGYKKGILVMFIYQKQLKNMLNY